MTAKDSALDLLADWVNRRDGGAPDPGPLPERYWWREDVPWAQRRARRLHRAAAGRDLFVCAACGGEFVKGWTDAEALEECVAVFGDLPVEEDQATLCDPCYRQFMEWARSQQIVGG